MGLTEKGFFPEICQRLVPAGLVATPEESLAPKLLEDILISAAESGWPRKKVLAVLIEDPDPEQVFHLLRDNFRYPTINCHLVRPALEIIAKSPALRFWLSA